ncbi:hypothetical protein EXIGLDRAFT_482438 [Exidia glandulosa HHB12029]|uniref:Secreted protein n=1 Tax=Exidia glandulosa HHB12029 TaxID=1314781 RepID=A0A165PHX6_EXIGL|nr:hypothetical protein EXIGLDRAFT_482438 [Exidia glandulosa HHB12029]
MQTLLSSAPLLLVFTPSLSYHSPHSFAAPVRHSRLPALPLPARALDGGTPPSFLHPRQTPPSCPIVRCHPPCPFRLLCVFLRRAFRRASCGASRLLSGNTTQIQAHSRPSVPCARGISLFALVMPAQIETMVAGKTSRQRCRTSVAFAATQ